MISKIQNTFILDDPDQEFLDSHIPYKAGDWDLAKLKPIKDKIHNKLLIIQANNCAYCGLKVNEGGRAELDHIAKKGGKKRPAYVDFTFTKNNLVISCQYCNSSSKKGQDDALINIDYTNYLNCTFRFVHPYFDNPDDHFNWSNGKYQILISSKTNKGKYSINLFELDAESHTLARAKQKMFEEKLQKYNKRQAILDRIIKIVTFSPK